MKLSKNVVDDLRFVIYYGNFKNLMLTKIEEKGINQLCKEFDIFYDSNIKTIFKDTSCGNYYILKIN
jgi:hypothetical protein